MLLAQEYAPDLTRLKDKFIQTPLGLLMQGEGSAAIDRLGLDAKGRVQAMSSPEAALQTGMDFMGGGLLGMTKGVGTVYDFLKQTNKDTYPKIRTNKIFKNDVGVVPKDKRQQIDNIIKLGKESDLPTNTVNVNDLIPTQKNVTAQNLSDVKNVSSSEPILAVKDNGKYFIIDGHHRLSNQILNGQNEVQIKVLK